LARRAAFSRAQGHRFGVKVGSVSDVTIDPKTYLAVMHLSLSRSVKLPRIHRQDHQRRPAGRQPHRHRPGGAPDDLKPGGEINNTQGAVDLFGLIGQVIRPKSDAAAPAPAPARPPPKPRLTCPRWATKVAQPREATRLVAWIGAAVLDGVAAVGRVGLFAARGRAAFTPPWYPRQILPSSPAWGSSRCRWWG
jgi:hypothetical protein